MIPYLFRFSQKAILFYSLNKNSLASVFYRSCQNKEVCRTKIHYNPFYINVTTEWINLYDDCFAVKKEEKKQRELMKQEYN